MVYITGDIHGDIAPIYALWEKFHPTKNDIIIILGDAGINYTGRLRDRILKEDLSALKSTFFCIHGNHESRPQHIASYREKKWKGGRVLYEEDFPSILFPVDGDIFEIEEKQCLVIGFAMVGTGGRTSSRHPLLRRMLKNRSRKRKLMLSFLTPAHSSIYQLSVSSLKSISPAWITVRSSGWIPLRKCLIMKHGIWDIGILTSE